MKRTWTGTHGLWLSLAWLSASPALGCGRVEALLASRSEGAGPPAEAAAPPAQAEPARGPAQAAAPL
ncbi:hypothetical protein BE20_44065, partial [Sorangium cellulosum]